MKYLDFDLVIEPSAEGFVGRVSNAPGGAGSAEFIAPFSDLEVEQDGLLRTRFLRECVFSTQW